MKTKKAWLIEVDGTVTPLSQIENKELSLAEMYPIIGCRTVEHVGLKKGVDMWIDEEGLLIDSPVMNMVATDYFRKSFPNINPDELGIFGTAIITDNTKAGDFIK